MKILSVITIILIASSCAKKKEIGIWGFAYNGDNITLRTDHDKDFSFTVNEKNYEDNICSFNKKIELNSEGKRIRINISIDSADIRLFDTLVTIPKDYQKPFISFIYPTAETNFEHKVFVGDEASLNKY